MLCCQKGTKLPSINETYLKGSNGDRLNVSFPYLTMNDIGMTYGEKKEPFASETYTNLTLGHYVGGKINICRPKEAYILAEMVREMEGSVFHYDIQTDMARQELLRGDLFPCERAGQHSGRLRTRARLCRPAVCRQLQAISSARGRPLGIRNDSRFHQKRRRARILRQPRN